MARRTWFHVFLALWCRHPDREKYTRLDEWWCARCGSLWAVRSGSGSPVLMKVAVTEPYDWPWPGVD